MSNFVPSCRLCQTSYAITDRGCKKCMPAKQHMRWPEMALENEAIITRNFNLVKAQLAKAEAAVFADAELDLKQAQVVKALTDAVTKVSGEMRQLAKLQHGQGSNLSPEQKDQAVLDYLCDRPKSRMRWAMRMLAEVLEAREKGAASDS